MITAWGSGEIKGKGKNTSVDDVEACIQTSSPLKICSSNHNDSGNGSVGNNQLMMMLMIITNK